MRPRRTHSVMPRTHTSAMGRASSILALAALLAFPAAAQEIPDLPPPGLKLPHVVLMSMGGTIASKGLRSGSLNKSETRKVSASALTQPPDRGRGKGGKGKH